jgi:hypothetical protein
MKCSLKTKNFYIYVGIRISKIKLIWMQGGEENGGIIYLFWKRVYIRQWVILLDKEKFHEYIKERYEPQVKWYDKKSILNKRLTYLFQIPIIIMAAITPIFAALEYKSLTIMLSASVAAGTGILKYCKFEEHWHNYRTTCETLKKEMIHYKYKIDVYSGVDDPEKLFIKRIESIISQENKKWVYTVKSEKEESKLMKLVD